MNDFKLSEDESITQEQSGANELLIKGTTASAWLQLLTESFIDYAIFSTDIHGIINIWNIGAEHTFGFTEQEAIGQNAEIVFTPEDIANGVPEMEMATARTKGKAADERWHIKKDGSRFYASGMMAPLYDENELVGYAKIARDLTKQKNAAEELQTNQDILEALVAERTAELRAANETLRDEAVERKHSEEQRVGLLRKIVTTQEDERRRIARDLHDHLGQRLTALRLKIASLKETCSASEETRERFGRLEEIAAAIDSEVNFLAWELRPSALDDLGMVAAIGHYVKEWSQHFNIPAEFHSTGLTEKRCDNDLETNLYRITQEALNNTFKHAEASRASVLLELRQENIILIVEDDGKGLDVNEQTFVHRSGKGLGLIGMRERAAIVGGTVEIESAAGNGTTIFVTVPAQFIDDIHTTNG